MQETDKRRGFNPWVGKMPWRRAWQPTPGFLPGESHGQRTLGGYSPWGCEESDMTQLYVFFSFFPRNTEKLFIKGRDLTQYWS